MNVKWNEQSVNGQVLILSFAAREYTLSTGMLFGANTQASEVRLIGNGQTVLRSFNGTRLLTMVPGAPPVLLHGLTLLGQLVVEAGWLTMAECTLDGSMSLSDGGALRQIGGRVEARSTLFAHNRAGGNGGAFSIDGGHALLDSCRLEGNVAGNDGGAVHVRDGSVVLTGGTIIKGNSADNRGDSIFVLGGRVDYKLPCPLGHYINAAPGADSTPLTGAVDKSVPLPCAPGLYGDDTYSLASQSGPGCSGECPPGHFCPLGTVTPRPCGAGKFCPGNDLTGRLGATSALPCEEGTYSNVTMLSSAADCSSCPEGHACTTGSTAPVRCSPGTHAPAPGGLPTCKKCPAGTFQDENGAVECKNCTIGCEQPVVFFKLSRIPQTSSPLTLSCHPQIIAQREQQLHYHAREERTRTRHSQS